MPQIELGLLEKVCVCEDSELSKALGMNVGGGAIYSTFVFQEVFMKC